LGLLAEHNQQSSSTEAHLHFLNLILQKHRHQLSAATSFSNGELRSGTFDGRESILDYQPSDAVYVSDSLGHWVD
jgi:hypothetical protein